jgi:hypothetical protein
MSLHRILSVAAASAAALFLMLLAAGSPNIAVAQAPKKKAPANRPEIELIPLIDIDKDVVRGKWHIEKGELHCEDMNFVPRVQIPYLPPPEYDFIVSFRQPKLRNGISLVMPNPNGGSFFWFVGNGSGTAYGFFRTPYNQGIQKDLIRPDTVHTTVVEVRDETVRGLVDGKEMLKLQTDFSELSADSWRQLKDVRLLAVACDDPTVFTSIRLVEVSGKGKKIR